MDISFAGSIDAQPPTNRTLPSWVSVGLSGNNILPMTVASCQTTTCVSGASFSLIMTAALNRRSGYAHRFKPQPHTTDRVGFNSHAETNQAKLLPQLSATACRLRSPLMLNADGTSVRQSTSASCTRKSMRVPISTLPTSMPPT